MGREGGTPKRITRSIGSTAVATPPPPQKSPSLETRKAPGSTQHPSLTRDELFSSLLGRRPQLLEILHAIGPLDSPTLPLLLYGAASTGKTRAVLQIFGHLDRPFAYVSCRSCPHSPTILFDSVLDQLSCCDAKKRRRCERASQFVDLLKAAVSDVVPDDERTNNKSGSSRARRGGGNGKVVYLVFDNVELIRLWNKGSGLLSLLFKMHDIVNMPSLGLIFISSAAPETYFPHFGSTEPVSIFFPDYTEEELCRILIRNHDNPNLYSSFLKVVLSSFVRVSRRIDELSVVLGPLFHKYCEPLMDLSVAPDEATKRRLFVSLQPHIKCALNENFRVTSRFPTDVDHDKCIARKRSTSKLVMREGSAGLDFHMSVSAKYLLISAFLASRNPATFDGSLFDTMGGTSKQKRKRKISETSIQQKDNKAQVLLMKGPGSFSLERLLAIFQCITSVADVTLEDEHVLGDDMQVEDVENGLMSDVLLQLSTLCNANFISKGGSCPLECSTRYRSTINEDLALKVARSINFPLPKYVYRR